MLDGATRIVTSDLFRTEVFPNLDDARFSELYNNLIACDDFVVVGIHTAAYELAGKLRQRCKSVKRRLETPDALHIASAILARVDEFWTTEEKLVKCSNAGVITEVPIRYPYSTQFRLKLE
jgi:predicted nucleic acid-binding protein